MQDFGGENTHFVQDLNVSDITSSLRARGICDAHFNNGTFTLPKDVFAPNFLAAFQRILDLHPDTRSSLIVALNSDKSMRDSYRGKPNEEELNDELKSQEVRAENILSLLGSMYPYRKSAVIIYDEQTPRELYSALKLQKTIEMLSLHKVGFGTSPGDKPIIGSAEFPFVHASPLYNDEKPVMHQDTPVDDPSARAPDMVEKLTEKRGLHKKPYITTKGGLLIPVPKELAKYSAPPSGPRLNFQKN